MFKIFIFQKLSFSHGAFCTAWCTLKKVDTNICPQVWADISFWGNISRPVKGSGTLRLIWVQSKVQAIESAYIEKKKFFFFFLTNILQVPSWRMIRPSERCPASHLPWCLNRSAVPISPSKGGTHLASGPGALSGGSSALKWLHSEVLWWRLMGQKTSGQLVYIRWIV